MMAARTNNPQISVSYIIKIDFLSQHIFGMFPTGQLSWEVLSLAVLRTYAATLLWLQGHPSDTQSAEGRDSVETEWNEEEVRPSSGAHHSVHILLP